MSSIIRRERERESFSFAECKKSDRQVKPASKVLSRNFRKKNALNES